jgi:hypothetical protein
LEKGDVFTRSQRVGVAAVKDAYANRCWRNVLCAAFDPMDTPFVVLIRIPWGDEIKPVASRIVTRCPGVVDDDR